MAKHDISRLSADDSELFDVVDASDRILEQRPRADVHRLGLKHRAVHVFVFRTDGRLLIHLRSQNKEEFPGVWTSSASGHVSAGESWDAAAHRELNEELGFTSVLQRLHKFAACPETSMEFTWLYRTCYDGPVVPDQQEIQAVRWCNTGRLQQHIRSVPQDFSPAFRLLFRWYTDNAVHG